MTQTDIFIAGGGVAGLTLALLLASQDIHCTLAEPYPPKKDAKPTGRTAALMNSSLNVLKATGIWDEIKKHCAPLECMRLIDDSLTPEIKEDFAAKTIGLPQYGYNVPNDIMRMALYQKAKKHKNIDIVKNKLENLSLKNRAQLITLENNKTIIARLLVGADGRNSAVREKAGIKVSKQIYNQSAITCLLSHTADHKNTATEFHRIGGPFALVPMPGKTSSLVWVEKTETAQEFLKLEKHDFTAALQEKTKNILGDITLKTEPQSWPLCTIKAHKLTAPGIALIAEAAHVMSPITAQGLNLSLRDVAALAEIIVDHMRLGYEPSHQSVLKAYEKRRALDITTRISGVNAMNRIVSTDIETLKKIRRTGLKLTAHIPPLKKIAMQHGLAPNIDLGRLAVGKPL